MAIIGFIITIFLSIYFISSGVILYMVSSALGSSGKDILVSIIMIGLGLSVGYLGFINAPFEIIIK